MALCRWICVAALMTLLLRESDSQLSVCGLAPLNSRIIGGQDAPPGSWPWQLSLTRDGEHVCGGSLINNEWGLTTVKCLERQNFNLLLVHLGRQSLQGPNPNEVTRAINLAVTFRDEFGLIRLNATVNFTNFIAPVCLAAGNSSFASGLKGWVTGWGSVGSEVPPPSPQNLYEVEVPVVGNAECKRISGNENITENMMCTGFLGERKGPCLRDEGSPLVFKQGDRWIQAGITSFGTNCSEPDALTVYFRVSQFEFFIQFFVGLNVLGFISFSSPGNNITFPLSTTMSTQTELSAAPSTTPDITAEPSTTPDITAEPSTTPDITSEPSTTPDITAEPSTTPDITAEPSTTPDITAEPSTTPDITAEPSTTPDITAEPSTTPDITAEPSTTPDITAEPSTTPEITAAPSTTPDITAAPSTTPTPSTPVVCGRAQPSSRIVEGSSVAATGVWPWMASLQKNGRHVCGGTLVDVESVLSNADCFSDPPVASEWTVLLGRLKQNGSNPSEVSIKVSNISRSNLTGSNLAVLRLSVRPTLTDRIQPICLDIRRSFPVGSTCWAAGWSSGRGGEEQILQQFQTTVQNCGSASTTDSICTGQFTQEQGDTGGPLMCKQEGSWFQASVLSAVNTSSRKKREDAVKVLEKLSRFQTFLNGTLGLFLLPAPNTNSTNVTATPNPTDSSTTSGDVPVHSPFSSCLCFLILTFCLQFLS